MDNCIIQYVYATLKGLDAVNFEMTNKVINETIKKHHKKLRLVNKIIVSEIPFKFLECFFTVSIISLLFDFKYKEIIPTSSDASMKRHDKLRISFFELLKHDPSVFYDIPVWLKTLNYFSIELFLLNKIWCKTFESLETILDYGYSHCTDILDDDDCIHYLQFSVLTLHTLRSLSNIYLFETQSITNLHLLVQKNINNEKSNKNRSIKVMHDLIILDRILGTN